MRTYIECIPCFFKQAQSAAQLVKASLKTQKRILDRLALKIPKFSLKTPPPYMGRIIYNIVKEETHKKDPFLKIKEKSNNIALKLYPYLKKRVKKAKNKLLIATELACIGNIVDLGVKNSHIIEKEVESFLKGNFNLNKKYNKALFDFQDFKKKLLKAETILYLADNSGEVVFDRILIEEILDQFKNKKIFYAVKEKPIINDALIKDALFCGVDKVAKVISSGCDSPGIILEYAGKRFLSVYHNSDLIISKGQGNFEALWGKNKKIFFLFRAKCEVVARHLNCKLGDIILTRKK
ncbi:MAG: hypothetical protein DRP80_04645 [Candidatus Omnitrophota bacterium]|nr:MAG: hypothetical protein DRP69_06425 [Candidatus Omnitrophota bacterium]RKY43650.1 MAG: hypothetical protein DRP80_04645 [Candidatus Omnitrophota bacterium]